ncbi:PfkB family carbohydrate kinase [Methylopila henanensis]|uniref:PfkB family carbohydrate kinase n=1 Tax=Methylopila henanensis TaxID=873516 RepID=A0ABW4KAB2_9HYPH
MLGSFVAACTVTVEELPQPGESLRAGAFLMEPGGKGFNLALAAHRLGAEVDGLFAVGADLLGDLAEPAFRRAGLDLAMLRRKSAPTGGGVGFIAANGENCLAVAPGANEALGAEDVRPLENAIGAADLCLAQFEIADGPIAEAFAIARAAGRPTLLNPSPYRALSDGVLAATSILCVNAVEAAELAASLGETVTPGADGAAGLARRLFGLGLEALVVTRGGEGATVHQADGPPHVEPAFPTRAVDTLGCGDAFAAALAVALAEGRAWPEAMRRAAANGALTAAAPGVFDALPTVAALELALDGAYA